MKNFQKITRNALYILLPLCFFAVVHLLFAYATWEISPKNWNFDIRFWSTWLGMMAIVGGVFTAYQINSKD